MDKYDNLAQRGFRYDGPLRIWIDAVHRQVISQEVLGRLSARQFSTWAEIHLQGESWQFWIEMSRERAGQMVEQLGKRRRASARSDIATQKRPVRTRHSGGRALTAVRNRHRASR